ncbi:MAG: class I SAM-dependent methyltransferase [Oleiphilus sp.]
MSIYEQHILPHLINCACGSPPVSEIRQRIVPRCFGKVLEIGMGSGLNLPFYNAQQVEFIWGLEPSEGMRRKAEKNLQRSDLEIKWLDLPCEQIPLPDNCTDTVLLSFSLCTIQNTEQALAEIHRVLKPDGKLLFAEHGISQDMAIAKWQNRLNPVWKRLAGGCHLNKAIDTLISKANFEISQLERFYQCNIPKPAGYIYLGEANKLT